MLIGELSARSGVSTRSLRYYEKHGLLEARRAANGYRDYDEDSVSRAATVRLLFGMGIPRDVVVSVLGCSGADASRTDHEELAARLPAVLDGLDHRIGTMTRTREEIASFLAGRADSAGEGPRPH